MDAIITRILKKQNQILLQQIAEEYNLDPLKILNMYHTPTFYHLDISKENEYKISYIAKKKK